MVSTSEKFFWCAEIRLYSRFSHIIAPQKVNVYIWDKKGFKTLYLVDMWINNRLNILKKDEKEKNVLVIKRGEERIF